jgi:methionine synthase II (cobalamin-independent)
MARSTGVPGERTQRRPASVLDALPAWATTGVGSLPHTYPEHAAAHVTGEYDVPFCPQLPRLEGDMVREWLGDAAPGCAWSPDRDRERPAAWDAFLAAIARREPEHRVVKLQVTGPVTLARALEPDARNAEPLAREIATWLAANAAGQVAALRDRGLTALLVADEPALGVRDAPAGVWDPLRAVAPAFGLHLCCAVPWGVIEDAAPDVLSFDLAQGALDRRGAQALRAHLARGGRVAWGVLAAHRPERAAHAAWRLSGALARVGLTAAAVGPNSLLTPSCGTGRLSPRREAEVTAALAYVAASARGGAVRDAPGRA